MEARDRARITIIGITIIRITVFTTTIITTIVLENGRSLRTTRTIVQPHVPHNNTREVKRRVRG